MRLLLVEDENTVRRYFARALRSAGHEVLVAASGGEALDLLEPTALPDAVVTDLRLPDMSGAELIGELQARVSGLRVLVVTGGATDEAVRALGSVEGTVLLKPISVDELLAAVEQLTPPAASEAAQPSVQQAGRLVPLAQASVATNSSTAVLVTDSEGRVRFANGAACELLGRTQLIDEPWQKLLPGLSLRDSGEGGSRTGVYGHPDGRRLRLCYTCFELPVPMARAVIVLREVGDECAAAVRHATSEARYRQLTENLHVGLVVHAGDGRVVFCNAKACELLGLTVDQLQGKTSFDPQWNCVHEDGTPFVPEQHPDVVARRTGNPVREVVMGVWRPRLADRVWILVSAQPHFAQDGSIEEIVVTFSDISQLRRLQEDLKHSRIMESLGGVAGGVAHDFNNLLTVIASSAEWLREELEEGSSTRKEVDRILQTVRRAGGLTRKLLAFAARDTEREPQIVLLDDFLREVLDFVARTLGEDLALEQDLQAARWKVDIDPTELEQVLVNLFVNARDAMPSGGTLTVRTRQILGNQSGTVDLVEIDVEDTGVGIPEHLRERVFEPFFTTKPSGQGTGMGLSTVYGLVSAAGGSIRVEDRAGGGSRFRVRLPRALRDGVRAPQHPLTTRLRTTPATILLVDDEAAVRFQARRILERVRHRVIEVASGDEAIEVLRQRGDEIELVITDVVLRAGSGKDVAAVASEVGSAPPVLYLSGYPDWRVRGAGVVAAGAAFLRKPYTRKQLLEKVSALLAPAIASEPAEAGESVKAADGRH